MTQVSDPGPSWPSCSLCHQLVSNPLLPSQAGGCLLGQCSFQGLMIVITTGFIPLSLLSIFSLMVMWESSQWLWEEYYVDYWLKELQESMDRCTGRCIILEILLNTAFNTIQSINQSSKPFCK